MWTLVFSLFSFTVDHYIVEKILIVLYLEYQDLPKHRSCLNSLLDSYVSNLNLSKLIMYSEDHVWSEICVLLFLHTFYVFLFSCIHKSTARAYFYHEWVLSMYVCLQIPNATGLFIYISEGGIVLCASYKLQYNPSNTRCIRNNRIGYLWFHGPSIVTSMNTKAAG